MQGGVLEMTIEKATSKKKRGSCTPLKVGLAIILVLVILGTGIYAFAKTHFGYTIIQNENYSFLSVKGAKEKLEETLKTTTVELVLNGTSYTASYEELGVIVREESLEQLLEEQNFFKQNVFSLENMLVVNKEKLTSFLNSIPELQEDRQSENAYIKFDGNDFVIEKEVIGSNIDYSKAYELVQKALDEPSNSMSIDLTSAMDLPEIFSTDEILVEECKRLNDILSTIITFQLMDGSTYTINKEVMKDWIVSDGKTYAFNIGENVTRFVDELCKATKNVTTVQIVGSEVGYVTMPAFEQRIPKVMKEETIKFIFDKLENAESYVGKPVYDKDPVTENLTSYIEIDITRQRVFMYLDGKCILDTLTVTANLSAGYNTPTGVFYLNNKAYDTVLRGTNKDGSKYASPVKYWMPFYKGYGMHDASWRSKFGGDIYKTNGSHGCVNLQEEAAETIYENITYDMPIFIYES